MNSKNILNLLLLHIILIHCSSEFSASEFLNNSYNYRHILCSGNGEPNYNSTTNKVTCACKEGYVNEPNEKNKNYLNGHFVQCSYKQKSRFTAIFFTLCLPLGIDFYYLGRIYLFIVYLILVIIVLSLNISSFYLNFEVRKNSEKKTKIRNHKIMNDNKDKNVDKKEKILRIINKFFIFFNCCYVISILGLFIFHLTGYFTDSNNIPTVNDLNYLFAQYNEDNS